MGSAETGRAARAQPRSTASLYRFVRRVLGKDVSDAEIARLWSMDKKSLWRLKEGRSELPSLEKVAQLSGILGTSPQVVMAVAGGLPWEEMADAVRGRDSAAQLFLLGRWASGPLTTPTGPEYAKALLFDGVAEFLFGMDARGTIVACNRACQTLLGYAPDELIGRPCAAIFAGRKESERALRLVASSARDDRPFREPFAFRRRDGLEVRAELSCSVLSRASGEAWMCACCVRGTDATGTSRR